MINLVKHVLFEYCTLLMKMALDALTIPSTKSNFSLFINVETLLGLNAMMSLLEVVHSLIKFAQLMYLFICDFIVANEDLYVKGMCTTCFVINGFLLRVMCSIISLP